MPRGGHNKKPTALKILQGTARKDRAVQNEVTYEPAKNIDPPENLEGLALITWQDLAPKLAEKLLLTVVDLRVLECYCFSYANLRKAQELLDLEGPVVTGATGGPVKNPAASVVNESMRELRNYSALLGLDPASRSRINSPMKDKSMDNPFLKL